MGRALGNIIINLKGNEAIKEAIEELGLDLDVIEDQEPDAALGNGGLGRLAACFLDSLATLGYPAYGCGIRYKYGMFKQKIENGFQIETPDDWLKHGNPLEMKRAEYAVEVKFGGYVTVKRDENGKDHYVQENYQSVRAVPYDLPVVGYNNSMVNTLRIWDAEAIDTFSLDSFEPMDKQDTLRSCTAMAPTNRMTRMAMVPGPKSRGRNLRSRTRTKVGTSSARIQGRLFHMVSNVSRQKEVTASAPICICTRE